jgi:hypothetical protein
MSRQTLAAVMLGLVCSVAAGQPARAQQTVPAVGVPVSYTLPTDGPLPQTYRVTLAITAPDDPDWIVSTFAAGEPRTVTAENKGKFTETWDGLDDNFMPVPPGTYGVKGIYMPARKWEITGDYHSLIPKLVAGAGDSWFPTRDQDTKYPWLWGASGGSGTWGDISIAPADSGRNGIAVIYHSYIECALNPLVLDLNKPIGHEQILTGYDSGGAGGGWATATDGELVWSLCANGGIPFLYRADGKRFGTDRARYRRDVYVPRGEPTSLAAWRDPATGKRYVYLAQETALDPADLPWQFRDGRFNDWVHGRDWKATEGGDVVILDGENGTELGRTPIAHPRQLQLLGGKLYALQRDGGQWKVSALVLDAGMPHGAWQPVATIQGVDNVTDCKRDARGNLYVSDLTGNQVYKLDPQGRIVHRFGRATRQTPGRYDDQVFMSPGKLAIWTDGQGQERLLVIETAGPNRMSEWTTDGKLLRQWFCGNWAADGGYCADPENPEHVYTGAIGGGMVRYKVDYDTGAWTVDAVWPEICRQDGKFPGGKFRPRIVSLEGRKYLVFARNIEPDAFGVIIYRQQGDDWMPAAALIPGKNPKDQNAAFWWHDANGDGQLQPEEYQNNPTTLPGHFRYWGEQWLEDLSLVKLQMGTPDAWRIAPAGFDTFGNPIYDGKGWTKLLTDTVYAARKAGTADALRGANEVGAEFGGDWQMIDGSMQEGFYVNARHGSFPGDANHGLEYKISRYIPDGKGGFKMKWRVGRTKFNAAAPGQIYGSIYITKPINGLIGIQDSTMGLYHVYSEDGLFVDTLFADGRRVRPEQGGTYLLNGENFSGTNFLNRKNGKVYVGMASNQPCTLFEIDGWAKDRSPVRRLTTVDKQVTIASAQIAAAPDIAVKIRGGAGAAKIARFLPAVGGEPALDGSLRGWEGCDPVTFRADEKQSVEVRCMYDPGHLYLRWHTRFAGKFTPQPLAPIENIFSGGRGNDTVSFYLQGDPAAKPGGPAEGRPGDVRIVFGVFKDGDQLRPVALGLYPKWFGPGKADPFSYASPVGSAKFEHVGLIEGANVGYALDEDGQGWTLAARLPKAAFPKLPEFGGGLRTLANFEANFGGHNKFWWANSDGSANTTTWDEPSEARLYPGSWAPAEWVGVDQMYVHTWNVIGPFGFAKLPKLDTRDERPQICATFAETKYPPEEKVDLAATYTGDITQTRVTTRTLQWKEVFEPGNQLEFNKLFRWRLGYGPSEDEGAAYAVTYLYSPVAADITLHAEGGHGHHAVRGWFNGQPLPLDPKTLPMDRLHHKIDATQPVTLQAGWNELLLRFDYIWGDLVLSLRLDAKPETLWGLRFSATPPKAANQ